MDTLSLGGYVPVDKGQLLLADGRRLRLLSDASFQLTDSSGRHQQYGAVEAVRYEPSLTGQFRKFKTVRASK